MDNSKVNELDLAGLQAALSNGGEGALAPSQEKLEARKTEAVHFIHKNRTRQWDEEVVRKIDSEIVFLKEHFPAEAKDAIRLAEQGRKMDKLFQKAWKTGTQGDKAAYAKIVADFEQLGPDDAERARLKAKFDEGVKKGRAIKAAPTVRPIPAPDYDLNGENPHFLLNLAPSHHWTVAMDETGGDFSSKAVSGGSNAGRGKYVAVLVPEESGLKRLSGGDHAMENNDARTAALLTDLYASRPYCGILGVTLDDMAAVSEYAHVNYWYNLIERTIDLVLRLVPLADKGKTRFSFFIEARMGMNAKGATKESAGMALRALHTCLYRLAKADPERERQIEAEIFIEDKRSTKKSDFLAYNGYADALACAWAAKDPRREIAKSLSAHGLLGTCLLSGSAQNLPEYLDNVHQGIPMSAIGWTQTIQSAIADGADSITGIVLGEFGERVKSDEGLWKRYLDETLRHVDSHAINLRLLGAQIEWLSQFMPPDMKLPPRLELLWLTVRLAHANHSGATKAQMKLVKIDMDRFLRLVSDLYEEDAPLTCWATLHLAVQATDSFEFDRARKIVQDFLDIGIEKQEARGFFAKALARLAGAKAKAKPLANPAVMGLRYHSELLSSLGQHAAFMGDNATAMAYFRQAIDGFAHLSEENLRNREIDQTNAYLATAAMDNPSITDTELGRIMRDYLGSNPEAAASSLAASKEPAQKYHHHILLRYLVSGRAPKKTVDAYLKRRQKWAHNDDGHPWELIDFYRAILVDDREERIELLRSAYGIARSGGPTLWVIACVILNALVPLDPSVAQDYRLYLAEIKKTLPALGEARLAALEAAAKTPVPPLDLAKAVLPFNFR